MYAVLVQVSINDGGSAEQELRERVVPHVASAPGFVAGYWTRSEDGSNGRSLLVFESKDAAQQLADGMAANVPQGVTFESAEVREVIANA